MAEYVTKIRTESGDLQIDYNSLANLPDLSPEGLGAATQESVESAAQAATNAQNTADAAVTAAANAQNAANQAVTSAENAQNTANTALAQSGVTSVNGKTGEVTLSASDVGAANADHTQASTTITTGGSEGQICAVNANGTISPNSLTIAELIMKSMFVLEDKTLYINTNV